MLALKQAYVYIVIIVKTHNLLFFFFLNKVTKATIY
jgi:hypothetical protein